MEERPLCQRAPRLRGDAVGGIEGLDIALLQGRMQVHLVHGGHCTALVDQLLHVFGQEVGIDRTGVNAWEDADFRAATERTGRRKVVIAGLWTEVCLALVTLDLLAEGYDVYPVADAVDGISKVSHNRAFDRMIQAGARPVTAISFGSELMRNWARPDADNLRKVMRWYFPERNKLPHT